jgi:hypothetical protein
LKPHPEWRSQLPIFERRDAMYYRVHSATVSEAPPPLAFDYPLEGWQNANPASDLMMTLTPEGLAVASDSRRFSYCVQYKALRAPWRGVYRFEMAYTALEGRIRLGILSSGDRFWIPTTVTSADDSRLEISVELAAKEGFSLVVFNDLRRDGYRASSFTGCVARAIRRRHWPNADRGLTASGNGRPLSMPTGGAVQSYATCVRSASGSAPPPTSRNSSPGSSAAACCRVHGRQRVSESSASGLGQVRSLAPLRILRLPPVSLRSPTNNLHVNGCGDFQLVARDTGTARLPEFETFSMNIDGLFSYIADAAGIREEVLPMAIYHLEHEVGSGWSPEGEAVLRKRIADSGITWVDASTVYVWAAYMLWLGRPMIFNGSDWGLANATLVERQIPAACDSAP